MSVRVLEGDVLAVLPTLEPESVHCVVTSPPYYGLRDYGTALWGGGDAGCDHIEKEVSWSTPLEREQKKRGGQGIAYRSLCGQCGATRVDSQLGLESTPEQYVQTMVAVFREVRRVLRRDGTLWLNIGDSYAGSGKGPSNGITAAASQIGPSGRNPAQFANGQAPTAWIPIPKGLKSKDLIGIPWMLAFALRADGWYLRSDIIWSKPNPMPESVTDRPTKAHEYLFLLTKSARYFYDADAIREPHERIEKWGFASDGLLPHEREGRADERPRDKALIADGTHGGGGFRTALNPAGRNKRSVWEIATQPFPEAHFATFPTDLVEPCIKAGTSEHGCCPECGAPWVRVVERTMYKPTRLTPGQQALVDNGHHGKGGHLNAAGWRNEPPATSLTTGWRPSCTHTGDPVPATVLDPFSGAGTTLLVADRLNRHGLGIELSPAYAAMARQRITSDNPLFVEVENAPAVPVRWDAHTQTLKDTTPPTVLDGQLELFLDEDAA